MPASSESDQKPTMNGFDRRRSPSAAALKKGSLLPNNRALVYILVAGTTLVAFGFALSLMASRDDNELSIPGDEIDLGTRDPSEVQADYDDDDDDDDEDMNSVAEDVDSSDSGGNNTTIESYIRLTKANENETRGEEEPTDDAETEYEREQEEDELQEKPTPAADQDQYFTDDANDSDQESGTAKISTITHAGVEDDLTENSSLPEEATEVDVANSTDRQSSDDFDLKTQDATADKNATSTNVTEDNQEEGTSESPDSRTENTTSDSVISQGLTNEETTASSAAEKNGTAPAGNNMNVATSNSSDLKSLVSIKEAADKNTTEREESSLEQSTSENKPEMTSDGANNKATNDQVRPSNPLANTTDNANKTTEESHADPKSANGTTPQKEFSIQTKQEVSEEGSNSTVISQERKRGVDDDRQSLQPEASTNSFARNATSLDTLPPQKNKTSGVLVSDVGNLAALRRQEKKRLSRTQDGSEPMKVISGDGSINEGEKTGNPSRPVEDSASTPNGGTRQESPRNTKKLENNTLAEPEHTIMNQMGTAAATNGPTAQERNPDDETNVDDASSVKNQTPRRSGNGTDVSAGRAKDGVRISSLRRSANSTGVASSKSGQKATNTSDEIPHGEARRSLSGSGQSESRRGKDESSASLTAQGRDDVDEQKANAAKLENPFSDF